MSTDSVAKDRSVINRIRTSSRTIFPFIGLVLMYSVFALLTKGKFTTLNNLMILFNQTSAIIIAGVGVSFVISTGGLDFSSGSLVALSAACGALTMRVTDNLPLSFAVIIIFAGAAGLFNGFCVTRLRVPSFIMTISMLFMFRGLTIAVCAGGSIPLPLWTRSLDTTALKASVLLIVVGFLYYLFTYTKFGVYCRAIGSGEIAARFAGVPVRKVKMFVFVISGVCAGIASIILLLRTGSVSTRFAQLLEVEILTALVLGGMPLTGGSGSKMRSIIIGGFIVTGMKDGLLQMGATDKILQLFMGALFLIAVALSFDRKSSVVIK